jgi:type IX secretion system PorP/SprF family membrane protein
MKYIISISFFLLTLTGFAQQDPQHSFYFFNPLLFNPAYAGSNGVLNITSVSRVQYVGWDGAPKTQFLSVQAPIARKKIGLGASISYDKIGARTALNAMANFAYHIQLNEDNLKLSLGLSGGFAQNDFGFSGLIVTDQSDPNYLLASNTLRPNFGFGTYLYGKKFYAGLSVPKLLKQSIDNQIGNSINQPHLYLMGGYVFPINSVIDLKPSMLVKYTENAPVTADLNVSAFFYKQIWLGVMYRMNESIGVNTSCQLPNGLMFGYAFDYPINGMRLSQFGNHELVISINLFNKKNAFISPRYF